MFSVLGSDQVLTFLFFSATFTQVVERCQSLKASLSQCVNIHDLGKNQQMIFPSQKTFQILPKFFLYKILQKLLFNYNSSCQIKSNDALLQTAPVINVGTLIQTKKKAGRIFSFVRPSGLTAANFN